MGILTASEALPVLPDLNGIRGLLTDLDNTLYAYEPAHRRAMAAAGVHFGEFCDLAPEVFARRYRDARQRVTDRLKPQGACRSRLFAFQLLCEEHKVASPHHRAFDLDEVYWSTFLDHMVPHAPAMILLDRCRDLDIPICVVTDMTAHVQVRKLDRLALADRISYLVTSEEVGCEKPDVRMFVAGLAKLGIAAGQGLMVGDDQVKDIDGANAAGIRASFLSAEGGL